MVQMEKVTLRYGKNVDVALNGIDLEIHEGELVFLVGPSGSGKTSIIKLLTGEVKTDSGEISVNGFDLRRIKRRKLPALRRTLGVIFQDFRLIDKMTVYDNVAFAMRVIGASNKEVEERVGNVLELVGLENYKNRYPKQLSGGEQQRVSIARAIAKNPDLLLCDEPTGALDYNTGIAIMALLSKLNREMGKTLIVITHNSDIALMADRVIRMRSGQIIENTVNENPINAEEIKW